MKCYYEILEVSRDADDSEIKTAYRKLALKWHPDKNIDNTELAKEQFQLVQQAYEVLSDRQERAWYDNHREQILRGSNSDFTDNSLDVFPYFTTQCFKGYEDDENGFYTVYRNVFEKIAKEDIEFMDSKSDFDEIPSFGFSTSNYDEIVAPFYGYWMCYTTRKSYAWLSDYNINEIRNRRLLKLVEKDSKKIRQKAKKERNEEIRNLVAFVRKRDKRVQAYVKLLEEKKVANMKKQEELRSQQILQRKKEHENKEQAAWSKFDNVQHQLSEIEKNIAKEFGESFSEESDEEDYQDLYCVACNKLFKNPKAFANHESSKKHKENVEKLKFAMLQEENNEDEEIDENSPPSTNEEMDEETNPTTENIEIIEEIEDLNISSEEEITTSKKKKKKKNKKVIRINDNLQLDTEIDKKIITKDKLENKLPEETESPISSKTDTLLNVSDDDFETNSSKKQKKKNKKQIRKTKDNKPNEDKTSDTNDEVIKKSKLKGKKQISENLETIDTSHVCVKCKTKFNSKNKLFEHLRKSGHSTLLSKSKN